MTQNEPMVLISRGHVRTGRLDDLKAAFPDVAMSLQADEPRTLVLLAYESVLAAMRLVDGSGVAVNLHTGYLGVVRRGGT